MEKIMIRLNKMRLALAAAMLCGVFVSGAALAQSTTPPPRPAVTATAPKAEPSTWDKTKSMSRKQWNSAKARWASEKVKWKDCSAKSKDQRLRGTKRWTFIGHCMTD